MNGSPTQCERIVAASDDRAERRAAAVEISRIPAAAEERGTTLVGDREEEP
jgi:hypothetical protein